MRWPPPEILRVHRQGRMVYYQANIDSPLFPAATWSAAEKRPAWFMRWPVVLNRSSPELRIVLLRFHCQLK